MSIGAVTSYIDWAQLALYGFWFFFFALIVYLQRENMREGYPLENEVLGGPARKTLELFPVPPPKQFHLHDGRTITVPRAEPDVPLNAQPFDRAPGAPLEPLGNPLLAGVGPGTISMREDEPEMTFEGTPMIVPLRVEATFSIASEDRDPRGMRVIGCDRNVAGQVVDCWVDRAEPQIRYFEVALEAALGARHVLVPINFTRVRAAAGEIEVLALLAAQFADVPATRSADQVTKLEEERITAYFAAGTLYATPERQEPLL